MYLHENIQELVFKEQNNIQELVYNIQELVFNSFCVAVIY